MATAPQPEPGPDEFVPPPSGYAPPESPPTTTPPPAYPPPTYPQQGYPQPTPQSLQGPKPSPYWALSAIALLCSLLFGVIGLTFSYQVISRWDKGDAVGAKRASTIALVVDLIGIAIGVIALIAVASSGGSV